jgi:hypothetical protein
MTSVLQVLEVWNSLGKVSRTKDHPVLAATVTLVLTSTNCSDPIQQKPRFREYKKAENETCVISLAIHSFKP